MFSRPGADLYHSLHNPNRTVYLITGRTLPTKLRTEPLIKPCCSSQDARKGVSYIPSQCQVQQWLLVTPKVTPSMHRKYTPEISRGHVPQLVLHTLTILAVLVFHHNLIPANDLARRSSSVQDALFTPVIELVAGGIAPASGSDNNGVLTPDPRPFRSRVVVLFRDVVLPV
jgi:hypothetical protein